MNKRKYIRRSPLRRALKLLSTAGLLAAVSLPGGPAEACGIFSKKMPVARPSLALERVLITHDQETKQQHFIRQLSFRAGKQAFGFVVPTPNRPDVAAVEEKLPFDRLQAKYPLIPTKSARNAFGTGKGRLGGGVRLLQKSKVGSFTAFVLAASDENALATWLKEHDLVSTPKADRWLTHYVRMKFYFVALRYDPPKDKPATNNVVAETIRISFKTPVPYYPYYEPEPEADSLPKERVLQLWLLSKTPAMPVSLYADGKTPRWVKPLHGGETYWLKREQIHDDLGPILKGSLPDGNILLQTFQDQKSARNGFGDIVFIPSKRRALSKEQQNALSPLLGVLDPSLVPKKSAP